MIETPTKEDLKQLCEQYMEWLENVDFHVDHCDDWEHAIFEMAMQVCCGPDVFDKFNALILAHEEKG